MSLLGSSHNSASTTYHNENGHGLHVNHYRRGSSRSRTPNNLLPRFNRSQSGNTAEVESLNEDNPKTILFRSLYAKSEANIEALFSGLYVETKEEPGEVGQDNGGLTERPSAPPKKPARAIDEDDYDDSEEDEEALSANVSPLKAKSTGTPTIPRISSPMKVPGIPPSPAPTSIHSSSNHWQGKTSDDARKRLEEAKKAAEESAKRSFQTLFYTLDNDRDAMLEQQKLEELDRQVDVEISGTVNAAVHQNHEKTLSQANLGASSLVLKHLIARIDARRDRVRMQDNELRSLLLEVKKNRSKWANTEKIGQEELYEAAEKVLSEIKGVTEHSQPFQQRVNKKDAPDYYNIIKTPMDLQTMAKKLKGFVYKSKQEFVDDLNLIWANCLKYNANPEHYLRRHALFMRKETEKLIPLIPDIVIRDRAEVEAEERRLHAVDGDADDGEDSDDEPIISSRGRKAPGKKAKKGSNARKALPGAKEGSPALDSKPGFHVLLPNVSSSNLRNEFLRADSDVPMEGSQNGLNTPPPGTLTPAGMNGALGSVPPGSQADPLDIDGFGVSIHNQPLGGPEIVDHEDLEYKTWKQVTKRDRALVAAERNRLFKGDRINPDEPALLRNKISMRRWMQKQKEPDSETVLGKRKRNLTDDVESGPSGATLAEGMEGTEEKVLPDYYDTVNAMPEIPAGVQWLEDSEGNIMPHSEDALHSVPKGLFTAPDTVFAKKLDSNMRQMQETRKVCTKIGIIKQMQLQSQMYQNQFQKYDPEPFVEQDIEPTAVSRDDTISHPSVARAVMQRSVAKIFYHAGFEEFQPSAMDAMTDIANTYFVNLARSLAQYMEVPKVAVAPTASGSKEEVKWKPKYTREEAILHCLHENGIDIESLESYAKEDADRLSGKLSVMHDRMKAHLADLLRPALNDAGPDGANAFNDGSDQFVGGDFAEDLDEDFFGFKDLGLDKEFGLMSLSVPLHLLQNRMHNAYQAQNTSSTSTLPSALPPPPPYPPVTIENIGQEIGLVQEFFRNKLAANNNQPLVEDEDLPQKQRFPKPRLPPTGKISSPRKKPVREAGPGKGHPRKKMKLVDGGVWVKNDSVEKDADKDKEKDKSGKGGGGKPTLAKGKATSNVLGAASMERSESRDADGDADMDADADGDMDDVMTGIEKSKEKGLAQGKKINGAGEHTNEGGMISPESLEAP